jgi:hypothetical protein
MLKRGTRGDKLLLGTTFAIVFLACGACIGLGLFVANFRVKSDFCQPTDQVYQYVAAHAEAWSDHFSSLVYRNGNSLLRRQTAGGEWVIVSAEYFDQKPDSAFVMYVSAIPGWPSKPRGYAGYLIIPAGAPPAWWQDWYDLQPMSDQIFCYTENDRTSL